MFGSIFRMRPKSGQEQAVVQLFEEWSRERGYRLQGSIASYLFHPEKSPEQLIGVAIFQDKETYVKNAEDPAQDAWYQRLRALLEGDPEWEDADIPMIAHFR